MGAAEAAVVDGTSLVQQQEAQVRAQQGQQGVAAHPPPAPVALVEATRSPTRLLYRLRFQRRALVSPATV